MMREDKFVQVYANGGKMEDKIYYVFTVHPSPSRPKGCFTPVSIGEIGIQPQFPSGPFTFTVTTGTEWDAVKHQHTRIEKNLFSVYLFANSINKCLTQLLTFDIPELSFLAGKLLYKPAKGVAVDWSKAEPFTMILKLLSGEGSLLGIPDLPQAKFLLQIADQPIQINKEISLTSIMPVSDTKRFELESQEPITRFEQLRPYLWWQINLPDEIGEDESENGITETIEGFTDREGHSIYTQPLYSIEDLPFRFWLYIKNKYHVLPPFYDENSFEVSRTLNSIKEGVEL